MRAKTAERARARELRLQGCTYDEIAARLGVSKSSVSLWTRDLSRPTTAAQDYDVRQAGAKRYFDLRRRRVFIERQNEKLAWANEIGSLTERELMIAGAVVYWAEGTKSKPWRREERVTFVNSDASMIRLFLAYLNAVGVEKDRLRYQVQIHETADVVKAECFWADVVDVPVDRLQPSTLKRHRIATNRKNVGLDYHGCLCVRVLQGAALYRRIEGTWWAVGRQTREAVPASDAAGTAGEGRNLLSGLPLRPARFPGILLPSRR
jgi:transcriptional regulator with XRE-family HTH domain